MRTKITSHGNSVTVERDDPVTDKRVVVTYFVPRPEGYVRIRDRAGRYPQVCVGLAPTGDALTATPDGLLAVIRRELRRAQAYERREMRR